MRQPTFELRLGLLLGLSLLRDSAPGAPSHVG